MSQKTVFLSYRRDDVGRHFAGEIEQFLTLNGYDVFLDVDGVGSGKWPAQIITQVTLRAHFLVLLTKNALDRCTSEDDWVRQEFLLAVQNNRNIVPVVEESVDINAMRQSCPDCMKPLFDYQAHTIRQVSRKSDLQILITRYIPPQQAPTTATPLAAVVAVSRLTHAADKLIGREAELKRLDEAWQDPKQHVLIIRGIGGEGKTSLVVDWTNQLAARDYDGASYFDWSFYSQGASDKANASSDSFIAAALEFFGGVEGKSLANSATAARDKAVKLVEYIRRRKTLLVLDGLEPLQYPPGPQAGMLRDPAMAALLKGLAQKNPGLCVVTTREPVADLAAANGTTAPEWELECLSDTAGASLLQFLLEPKKPKGVHQVNSTPKERIEICQAVRGHALTLRLLGGFIHKALRDVRRWREVDYAKADEQYKTNPNDPEARYGHAFKTIEAYETWLARGDAQNVRQLAVLRLLGLFDRPAIATSLAALRAAPIIPGLTDPLVGLAEDDWNTTVTDLETCGLVSVKDQSLDAHPLLREYFARRLRSQQNDAFRAAHRRLYAHLCANTKEGKQPTIEQLQPLYQAVAHGCFAGMQQEVHDEVHLSRIRRGNEEYSVAKLGALGAEVGAAACFFERLWSVPSRNLKKRDQHILLGNLGFLLGALGRLTESLELLDAAVTQMSNEEDWEQSSFAALNLAGVKLTLGQVVSAVSAAEKSISYADRSGGAFQRLRARAHRADALYQAGRRDEAERCIREAEEIQRNREPACPLLYSVQGFVYCDVFLAAPERAVWQHSIDIRHTRSGVKLASIPSARGNIHFEPPISRVGLVENCNAIEQRVTQTLGWTFKDRWLVDIGLAHLALGRAVLYRSILGSTDTDLSSKGLNGGDAVSTLTKARTHLDSAVDGLRHAGFQDYIPLGLLSRAWFFCVEATFHRQLGEQAQAAECETRAQADLDEAWEIAERGPMRLHMADIHLYRARLFHAVSPYPWPGGAKGDLKAARALIEQCGYWRRKEELEDAEAALA